MIMDILFFAMCALAIILLGIAVRSLNRPQQGTSPLSSIKTASKPAVPTTNQMAPTIQMQRLAAEISKEDRDWFLEQARTAGFDIWDVQPRLRTVPVRKETLGLAGGSPVPGLIIVGDKQYQKFSTTNDFFYLEEVTRAPEVQHEEGTTVRDFTGHILTRYTCTECSSSNVPDNVRTGNGHNPDL